MSALPESVRRQAELSNQLLQKQKAGTLTMSDVQMTPEQVQMPPPEPRMPNGFQAQPAGDGVPGLGTPGFNPQPAQAPQAQAPAAPAPAPQAAPQPDPADDHRFKVLQGKYNAEVPRLHQQVRDLQAQLSASQSILANLSSMPAVAPQPAAQAHHTGERLVTDKDVKEFGDDLIDVVRRVAREEVNPRVRTLEEQFRPVAQTVQQMAPAVQQAAQESQQTAQELAHERICNGLDRVFPAWEQVNDSPEFATWLAQVDPYAGTQRGAMLAAAYKSGDVPRIAAFFSGFQKEHAAVVPPQAGQQPAPPQGTPAVSLQSLAAPGQANVGGPVNAGAPIEQPGSRVYTQRDISEFYKAVQKGAFRGKDAERTAIERDIFAASNSGRVRP